jgi:hypothetical protein
MLRSGVRRSALDPGPSYETMRFDVIPTSAPCLAGAVGAVAVCNEKKVSQ